jgi:hypothetical protein
LEQKHKPIFWNKFDFINQNSNKFLWANLEALANEILLEIQEQYPDALVSVCGEFRRKFLVLEGIDFLVSVEDASTQQAITEKYKQYPVHFEFSSKQDFYLKLLELSSDKEHYSFLSYKMDASEKYTSEAAIYEAAGYSFIAFLNCAIINWNGNWKNKKS